MERSSRPRLPELLLLTLILVAVLPWRGQETARQDTSRVELPVPASSLVSGSSALSPGQRITLKAFTPVEKDSTSECFEDVEIRAVDHQGTGTVLIAVATESAFSLEKALATKETRFTYHLVEQRPDGGDAGETCGPPTSRETPPAETKKSPPPQATLELPGADLRFQASPEDKGKPLRLVVAMTRPTEGQPSAVLDPNTSTATSCVKVLGFLDEQGVSTDTYDAQRTKAVRVQLRSDGLTAIAARLAVPSRIWLLADESCKPDHE